uniref:Uncharacterized protein n=1 Tax=Myotis myotis TaxID=51298 RepID=A0A7J7YDR4_MYOMY|nr:hypothetical protein mMyoMyo1_011017 [Myotis myotis]
MVIGVRPLPFPLANQDDMQINCQPRWLPAARHLQANMGLACFSEGGLQRSPPALPASELAVCNIVTNIEAKQNPRNLLSARWGLRAGVIHCFDYRTQTNQIPAFSSRGLRAGARAKAGPE